MSPNFPTREQLGQMSIARLRLIDVREKDEEDLLQEFISARLAAMPAAVKEVTLQVPDIMNGKDEAEWQKKIDEARFSASQGIAFQGKMNDAEIAPEVQPEPKTAEVVETKRRGRKPKQ